MVLPATRSGGWIRRRYDSRVSSFSNRLVATLCLAASLLMTLSIVTTNSFEEDVMSNPVVVHLQKPSIGSLKGLGPLPLSMKRFASLDPLTPNGDDGDDDDDCEWMHAWQEETFSSCNNLHEIDMTRTDSSLTFINCGSSRCAVSYTDVLGKKLVMKVVKSKKEFTESTFRKARRDALSMERLTSSPYVSDIYGSCGVSHLTEYGTGGTIHDLIKLSRNGDSGFRELKPLTKLKIAYQLATAVADMHSFEPDQVASLAHMDICCHQFVLIRGVYVVFLINCAYF